MSFIESEFKDFLKRKNQSIKAAYYAGAKAAFIDVTMTTDNYPDEEAEARVSDIYNHITTTIKKFK